MSKVLLWIFGTGYWVVFATVLIRALLMFLAFVKSPPDRRKDAAAPLLLSAGAECAWCALVGLSFGVSKVDLIPLGLSVLGLAFLRGIVPFERIGSQYVYSLLAMRMPKRQATLARFAAMHLY